MKDMLMITYDAMIKNDTIHRLCNGRIKFFLYPETADTENTFITLRPLEPPSPGKYASDKNLNYNFSIQIDVQSPDRLNCKEVQAAVKKVMEELGFSQKSGGLDTYFEETKRFIDARRYTGQTKIYDTNY